MASKKETKQGEGTEDRAADLRGLPPDTVVQMLVQSNETLAVVRQELLDQVGQNAILEAENRMLQEKNWNLRIDYRTGLERDLIYYTFLNQEIGRLIDTTPLASYLDKGLLTQEDILVLDALPLSVTVTDLGYLSKYNDDKEIEKHYGGHGGGDEVLRETGATIQLVDRRKREITPVLDVHTRGYRTGGDEFALIHHLTKTAAKEVARRFSLKQGDIKIRGSDLPTVVNCGTASIREAVEAFIQAIPISGSVIVLPEEKAKKLQQFLSHIADRRAKLAKGVERLITITRLFAEDFKKFKYNYRWLQKGAFGTSEQEFSELAREREGEDFEQKIKALVLEKLAIEIEQEAEQRVRERAAVAKIADRDLL